MRKSPFTLLEMVVAMTILLLVGAMIGTASSMFYNAYRRSAKITENMKEYIAVDQVMDQCVRNAVPFQWKDREKNEMRDVFLGEPDMMLFTALRRSHDRDTGALIFVRIRLIEHDLVAEYSPYPLLPWELEENDMPERYTREILVKNVQAVTFLYAERNTDGEVEFLEEWIEDDHDGIPLAIQMEIEWLNGEKERWLRRTAGSSAHSTYSTRRNQNALNQTSGRGGIR